MKTKSIILLIATVVLAFVGIVLLLVEPVDGELFYNVQGVVIGMKVLSLYFISLSFCSWSYIPEQDRNAIISWIKLHL